MSNYTRSADTFLSEVLSVDSSYYKSETGKTTCVFDPENWSYITNVSEELGLTKSSVINHLVAYSIRQMAMKEPKTLKYPCEHNGMSGHYVVPSSLVSQVKSGEIPQDVFFCDEYFEPAPHEVEYLLENN